MAITKKKVYIWALIIAVLAVMPLHVAFPAFFAVCDGMGGEEDGEIASQLAVQTLFIFVVKIKSSISWQLYETIQSYLSQKEYSSIVLPEKHVGHYWVHGRALREK
mgnify:CR=1 FL=1